MARRARSAVPASVKLTIRLTPEEAERLHEHAARTAPGHRAQESTLARLALASLGLLGAPAMALESSTSSKARPGASWRSAGAVLFSRATLGRQLEAARRLRVDRGTVSRWSSGRSCPRSYEHRRAISAVFGVDPEAWDRPWLAAIAA
jgi:hypothetical protein